MNGSKDTTVSAMATSRRFDRPTFNGYRDAFAQLEAPIDRVRALLNVQRVLAEVHDEGGTVEFIEKVAKSFVTITDVMASAVDDMEDLWLHLHNSGCDEQSKVIQTSSTS